MQFVYYTIAAVLLYWLSDWILIRFESLHGKPLKNRSVIFFVIILVLAISSFKTIEWIVS
jgi:hypothetical protein